MIRLSEIGQLNLKIGELGVDDYFVKKTTLQTYLEDRGWLKTEVIFYDKDNDDYKILKNQPSSFIEVINSNTQSFSVLGKKFDSISQRDSDFLINKYNDLYGISPRIRQYYSTLSLKKSSKHRLNDDSFVTKFLTGIDSYTDTLNLNDFLKYCFGCKGIIDLQVLYSIGNSIYNYSTILDLTTDVISSNNDIEIEYLGGVISLFPKTSSVSEYIIDKCVITYGRD